MKFFVRFMPTLLLVFAVLLIAFYAGESSAAKFTQRRAERITVASQPCS